MYTQQVLYSSSALPAYSGGYTTSSVTPPVSTSTYPDYGYALLKWGSKGDRVRRLQQELLNKGFTQVKYIDGIYGQNTYDAVCAFQFSRGLAVDGIAGRATQNALFGTHY